MGNLFSLFEESDSLTHICPLCDEGIIKKKYIYNDMECFQCKKRCASYYHPECWSNYMDTFLSKKGCFICYRCKNSSQV